MDLRVLLAAVLILPSVTAPRACANTAAETEQQLLSDAADGSLDDFSLLQGALIAGGVTRRQQIERYCAEFTRRLESVAPAAAGKSTVRSESERLYQFLYHEFLKGDYHETCTEIHRALDQGDYNCVTATILYHCICQARGLSPIAVATKTHVRSRFTQDSVFDVETTCREWFDVLRSDPISQKLRTQRQATRPLSEIELLAKIYYNRGVSLLEKKDFCRGIALLRISQLLDPRDEPTRENMSAALNNWALAEADAGDFRRAVELVQEGWQQHPEFLPFAANDIHIHQRWAVRLCKQGRFAEAMQALSAAHTRRPEVPLFDRGRLAVLGQWAVELLQSGDFHSAVRLFREAEGWMNDQAKVSQYQTIAIETAVERLQHAGRHDEANRLVQWALTLKPTDSRL